MDVKKTQGIFNRKIYENQNGFCIYTYKTGRNSFIVKGMNLPTDRNNCYEFLGEWVEDEKYGRQFNADYFSIVIGDTPYAIEQFFSGKCFHGIGPTLAKKIVEHFGPDVLKILDKHPERIIEVPGISKKKAARFEEDFIANHVIKDIMIEFRKNFIPEYLAIRAAQFFGGQLKSILKTAPYRLCLIDGISFQMADRFCVGIPEYEFNYDRFLVGAKHILMSNENGKYQTEYPTEAGGGTCMGYEAFINVAFDILYREKLTKEDVVKLTEKAIEEKQLVLSTFDGEQVIAPIGLFRIEEALAKKILSLQTPLGISKDKIQKMLTDCVDPERPLGEEQLNAVEKAFLNGLSLIIGYPGAGKTTTVKTIATIYEALFPENPTIFMAPSGKAAKRMMEALGNPHWIAKTCHSMLHLDAKTISVPYEKRPDFIIENSLVVIDEVSMLDVRNAYQIFEHIGSNCLVVMCGDDAQLPSVSSGAFLRDMIESNCVPISKLTKVYRSDGESALNHNANSIRNGIVKCIEDDSFHFIPAEESDELQKQMISTYLEKVKEYGVDNVMLISPIKKRNGGVTELNLAIEPILNAGENQKIGFPFGQTIYHIGDIVMNLKNITVLDDDKDYYVPNGEIGIVTSLVNEYDEPCIIAEFLTENGLAKVEYGKGKENHITLAYAYTVHKSQGSEAKCVITCTHMAHYIMLKRNILYTAITRAKKEVYVIGQKKAYRKAILTEDTTTRKTNLKLLLLKNCEDFSTIEFM